MKRKSIVLILLLLVCAALVATGTYAAYTNVEYIKRVVSTKAGANELRFSSNYLSQFSNTAPTQLISVSTGSNISITVTVCNYPQNNSTLFSEDDIAYTLTARLVTRDGNPIHPDTSISYTDSEGNSATMTGADLARHMKINNHAASGCTWTIPDQNLVGGTDSRNLYKITCDQEGVGCLSTLGLELNATPTTDVDALAVRLTFAAAAAVDSNWTYRFTDSHMNEPTKLDAFNVELSGTTQGTGKLTWDPSHVRISQWSFEELGGSGEPGDSITFSLGGTDQPTRYRLQFYRVGGIPSAETEDDVRGYVSFTFTSSENQSGTD